MIRRLTIAAVLLVALASAPHSSSAQVQGVAFAALHDGSVFEGFFGPWRITGTGMDINYSVLCYSTSDRRKVGVEAIASIPDGSTLLDIRTIATTAVVNACGAQSVTVARGAVVLPAINLGQ